MAIPLDDLRHDHDDHGAMLNKIAELTDNYTPPENACRTWQALYAGAAQLRADLTQHIHPANNVLFHRFEDMIHD